MPRAFTAEEISYLTKAEKEFCVWNFIGKLYLAENYFGHIVAMPVPVAARSKA